MAEQQASPGLMAICMTCQFQDRIQEGPEGATCTWNQPNVVDGHCARYRILPGDHLGPRLAELYVNVDRTRNLVSLLADVIDLHHPPVEEEEP